MFRLCHHFRLQLVGFLQVASHKTLGAKGPCLLTAAIGHLQQVFQPINCLAQVAASEGNVGAVGPWNRAGGAVVSNSCRFPSAKMTLSTDSLATPSGSTSKFLITASADSWLRAVILMGRLPNCVSRMSNSTPVTALAATETVFALRPATGNRVIRPIPREILVRCPDSCTGRP